MRRRDGFTLVELLVVISVISILMVILLPVFAQVRGVARRTKCSHNLLEIGSALFIYADDYRGWFPPIEQDGNLQEDVEPTNEVKRDNKELGIGRMWRAYISEENIQKFEELLDVVTCPATNGWNKTLEGVGLDDNSKSFYCSYLYRGGGAPIDSIQMYTQDDRDAMVGKRGTLALVTDANHDNTEGPGGTPYFNHYREFNQTLYADGSVDGKDLEGEPSAEELMYIVDTR
jgi:prepilin-type N-terminal cleavage/methylation domain-containing protein